jgi:hypothetical protein
VHTTCLDFLAVSQSWGSKLLESPLLWTTIHLRNTKDEMARVHTFLELSRDCLLDVDILTVLRSTESLQLIKPHLHRVATISIRPDTPYPRTALHAQLWQRAASYILATFSDKLTPSRVENISCVGTGDLDVRPVQYHVDVMRLILSSPVVKAEQLHDQSANPSDMPIRTQIWERFISR